MKGFLKIFTSRTSNNRGIFSLGGKLSGQYGSQKTRETINPYQWNQNPDYAESEGARGMWWERLQDWGGQPGYGAISPDWGDIWEQSKQRVRDYYSGTATQPGVIDKIRASAARRNVSDSPAVDTEITKALVEQGGQMGDLASQQSLAEASFGEQGRMDWLSSLMQLAQMNPMGSWQPTGGTSKTSGWKVGGQKSASIGK